MTRQIGLAALLLAASASGALGDNDLTVVVKGVVTSVDDPVGAFPRVGRGMSGRPGSRGRVRGLLTESPSGCLRSGIKGRRTLSHSLRAVNREVAG